MVRKAKPRRRWFWGLFVLILIAPFVALGMKDRIERDLTKRSLAALRAADISWAQPEFIGLDGVIKGEAPSAEQRIKAINIVGGVYGVRRVLDKLSLSKIVAPFVWSGRYEKGKIVLKGYVPNKQISQSVIGLAKAKFPQAKLEDKLKVARGAPDDDEWFGQISYGLGQLARMRYGTVYLTDKKISIIGSAVDEAAFSSLNKNFSGELPLKMKADSITIKPPLVENYFLNGKFEANSMLLEGVVPDDKSRTEIVTIVKKLYPGKTIEDNLRLGDGAPNDWQAAVLLSLTELSKLESGVFMIEERSVKLEGLAADKRTATSVKTTLRTGYPTGYKITDDISVKEKELPVASPFELRVSRGDDAVTIDGVVESEEGRAAILSAVKSAFPALKIVDETTLAKGAPVNFLEAIKAGTSLLSSINSGQLLLSDEQMTISGDTKDETVAKGFESKPAALPDNIDWINGVQFDDSEIRAREEAARKKAEEEAALKREAELAAEAEAKAKAKAEAKAEAEKLAAEKEAAELKAKAEAEAEDKARAEKAAREKAEAEAKAAAEAEAAKKAAEAEANKDEEKVTNEAELAKKRQWLSPEETAKRLSEIHKESGAVNAKECQLLMNSIVRGNAIRFGVNSSVINSSSYDVLSKVYSVAAKCSNTVIRVEGHTDSDGSDAYNLELSLRRARAVISHLGELGIPRIRLDTKGFGEKKPVASNGTAEGKALNRRIEFVVFEN